MNIEKLKDELPHGSGIDSDWVIEAGDNGKIYAYNSYHCMDEYGFYDGWLDFYLIIPDDNLIDFKLKFQGLNHNGYYRVNKYMLRDYLVDLFASFFNDLEA
jgi:hypothetical protein